MATEENEVNMGFGFLTSSVIYLNDLLRNLIL